MDIKVKQIAERIKGLREMVGKTEQELADFTSCSLDEYNVFETGTADFNFTFLYKVATALGVDITEIITGEAPHLTSYTLERKGEGLPISRRKGFSYLHKSAYFKGRAAQPFVVVAPFINDALPTKIALSTHIGQEFDFVLRGSLIVSIDGHIETLNEGDSIYYDSNKPHGMVATNGAECEFLAVVFDN